MSSLSADPWETLGIEKNADNEEVRAAFEKLEGKFRQGILELQGPRLKEVEYRFRKVQEAFKLLKNDAAREKYREKFSRRRERAMKRTRMILEEYRTKPERNLSNEERQLLEDFLAYEQAEEPWADPSHLQYSKSYLYIESDSNEGESDEEPGPFSYEPPLGINGRPLKPGLRNEDSRPVDVVLSIILGNFNLISTPDTGSEGNVISHELAETLGFEVDESTAGVSKFCLANGRVIHSCGQVLTVYQFPGEDSQPLPIKFDVIHGLIAKVIVGRDFLEATETLTKHATQRLSIWPRPLTDVPLILHLNLPRRMLQCYLNDLLVSANADTGAEMNLVSASFASKEGFRLQNPPPPGRRSVMLADGSAAEISGFFVARFNPLERPVPGTFRPRSHMKTFYVLDGLTSDVLLGRDLLFEIQAFTQQKRSFESMVTNILSFGSDLHIIEWLRRRDPKPDFMRQLGVDDRAETMRRNRAATAIANLPEDQRLAAEKAETITQVKYDQGRELRLADHKEETRRQKADLDIKLLPRREREAARFVENELRERYIIQEKQSIKTRHQVEMMRLTTASQSPNRI